MLQPPAAVCSRCSTTTLKLLTESGSPNWCGTPHDRRTAQRERLWGFWSGDIWRLIVLLKKYRADLSIHTIAAPPTGLAVVRNLDPSSRFIADNLGRLCAEFMALDYSYLDKDRAAKLNLFPNDWEQIRPLLARQL